MIKLFKKTLLLPERLVDGAHMAMDVASLASRKLTAELGDEYVEELDARAKAREEYAKGVVKSVPRPSFTDSGEVATKDDKTKTDSGAPVASFGKVSK